MTFLYIFTQITHTKWVNLIILTQINKAMTKKRMNGDDGVPMDGMSASTLPGSLILQLNVHLSIERSIIHICPNNPTQQ